MATETPSSDRDLVRAARGGNSSAAGDLIHRYAAGVVTVLARILRDRELALDLAQETFLRAYQNLERFDVARSFRAWLHSIAWNLAMDQLRRRRRRSEKIGISWGDGGDGQSEEPADFREEPPPRWLERREERGLVRQALGLLPYQHRAVLVLRELAGLSYEEIAEVLGCRLGTAKSRVNRARLRFREIYLRLSPSIEERPT